MNMPADTDPTPLSAPRTAAQRLLDEVTSADIEGWAPRHIWEAAIAQVEADAASRAATEPLDDAHIVGVVATALQERKVGLDTERHVLSELRAALASDKAEAPE